MDEYGVEYQSQFSKFVILESHCNKKLLTHFEKTIAKQFKTRTISSDSKKAYSVIYNDKSFMIYKESRLGDFLFQLDRFVMNLRLKEKVQCD